MEKMGLAEMTAISAFESDDAEFEALVHRHGPLVMRIAFAVVRNWEDAEDIAQETFFRVFRTGNLKKVENMRAWLGRIAWRLALNRVRKRTKDRKRLQPEPDDRLRTVTARDPGAEEQLLHKERTLLLESILLSLPQNLRVTFILLTVEGITSRCVADILGIPESSVRNRLLRARALIKEKLAARMEKGNEP